MRWFRADADQAHEDEKKTLVTRRKSCDRTLIGEAGQRIDFMKEPIRNYNVGLIMSAVGGLLAVVGYIFVKKSYTVLRFVDIRLFLGFLFIGLPLGGVLAVFGYVLASKDAKTVMEEDPRDPIVYLRSFRSDGARLVSKMLRFIFSFGRSAQHRDTLEEMMSEAFESARPFVAIGRPGEVFATPGAARIYVDDDSWQEVVRVWIERASLVIIEFGGSDGLWWEIREVLARKSLRQVLLFIDPARLKKTKCSYENLMKKADLELDQPLPRDPSRAHFIWFDERGNPMWLVRRKLSWWSWAKVGFWRVTSRKHQRLLLTLAPVLHYLRETDTTPRVDDMAPSKEPKDERGTSMALQTCFECASSVSDKANRCPHCGAPVVDSSGRPKKRRAGRRANEADQSRGGGKGVAALVGWVYFEQSQASSESSKVPDVKSDTDPTGDMFVGVWKCESKLENAFNSWGAGVMRSKNRREVLGNGTVEYQGGMSVEIPNGMLSRDGMLPGDYDEIAWMRVWYKGRQWVSNGRLCSIGETTEFVGVNEIGKIFAEALSEELESESASEFESEEKDCDKIVSVTENRYVLRGNDRRETCIRQ